MMFPGQLLMYIFQKRPEALSGLTKTPNQDSLTHCKPIDTNYMKTIRRGSISSFFDDLSSYFILNYWPHGEYITPGHIEGAYQYTPKVDLLSDAKLNTLPTDQKIAVYCYTGQTSAQLTAYLRILGYEAYSVTYGVNGFSYDQMIKSKYTEPTGDYSAILE